jgi:hypothetical protein
MCLTYAQDAISLFLEPFDNADALMGYAIPLRNDHQLAREGEPVQYSSRRVRKAFPQIDIVWHFVPCHFDPKSRPCLKEHFCDVHRSSFSEASHWRISKLHFRMRMMIDTRTYTRLSGDAVDVHVPPDCRKSLQHLLIG